MSELNYVPGHKEVMDSLVLGIPGVKGGKAFGYPAYRVNGKIFAFVGGPSVAIKLPETRVKELIAQDGPMKPFEPVEGTVWREWIAIFHEQSEDYEQDFPLFEESIQFVAR